MNKKFISALLFGAMAIASTSTFVSCKDYDDDITELRNEIDKNATDLSSLVDQKINNVNSEIASLRAQAEALDAAYKAADAALATTIANATNDAKGYADIQAAQAQTAAIAAAQQLVNDAKASLEAAVASVNAKIDEQGKTINSLLDADKVLTSAVTAAQAKADQAYALAEQANKLAGEAKAAAEAAQKTGDAAAEAAKKVAADLATAQKNLDDAIAGLKTSIANLESQVKVLGDKVTAVEAAAQKNAADIAAQAKTIEELKSSNAKALEDAVKAAKSELQAKIDANAKEIDALEEQVKAAKAAADAAVATAKAYTDAEVAKMKTAAVEASKAYTDAEVAKATEAAKAAQEEAEAAMAEAQKALSQLANLASKDDLAAAKKAADDAAAAAANATTAAANAQKAAEAAAVKADEALKATLTASIESVKTAYAAADAALGKDIEALEGSVEKINGAIDTIKKDLNAANANLLYESKRLKSLVFAPTTYVDGIECIKFSTLKYTPWVNVKADEQAMVDNKTIHIDNAKLEVQYLVNPKNVNKNDITALSFISNEASNTNTRAIKNAPISVVDKSMKIENGVMTIAITKNGTESFGTNPSNFTIVSLKATLADKFLTEDEVKNGEKAEVYSDWARLSETSVRPYIHNMLKDTDKKSQFNNTETDAHFWNFKEVYGSNTADPATVKLASTYDGQHIAKKVVYNEPIDLMTLVEVCDKDFNVYEAEKYGLSFKFDLLDYNLLNQGSTVDATNQKMFGKLKNGSVLTSTARDNKTENNRDAIGRQPMIRVQLMHGNNVVDVRYFKIQWVENAPDPETVIVTPFEKPFVDGKYDYNCVDITTSYKVKEEIVNALYASVGEFGLSRKEFHDNYSLCPNLFSSADVIKAVEPDVTKKGIGTITELPDADGAGHTYNYEWSINVVDLGVKQEDYNKGSKAIVAYGYFYKNSNKNERISFELKLNVVIEHIALGKNVNRDQVMWKDGMRHINPALESDANYGQTKFKTTQIIGSLLQGYVKNGKTPTDVLDMLNKGDNADFIFNITSAKGNWYVSEDGLTLYYDENNNLKFDNKGKITNYDDAEIAAEIKDGIIQLKESNPGAAGSEPTKSAKRLVGNTAPVILKANWCNFTESFESHDVMFLTPLEFTTNDIPVELQDITAGGSSKTTFAGQLKITEKFTTNKRVVWDNDPKTTNIPVDNLVAWYGIEDVDFQIGKAKTDIQLDGSIGSKIDTDLSKLTTNGKQKYVVDVKDNSVVTFENMSGNAIGQTFRISIPVSVRTKWQDALTCNIIVTVKPAI